KTVAGHFDRKRGAQPQGAGIFKIFDVFVAQQPMIRIPLDYHDKLEPVFEAIHREFLNTFQLEVLEFNDKRFETRIGFVPEN
ncbi:MAG: hypothetical protein AAFW68_13530, partial [Pseudomonadota bacterium]